MLEEKEEKRIFIFAKDKNGKFLFCNENHAEIAELDSPGQIIGKTDYNLFWRKNADHCCHGDRLTMKGENWVNATEKLTRYDGTFDICISKYKLLDEKNNCIGVVGSYYDIIKRGSVHLNHKEKNNKTGKLYLGEHFFGEYFTSREYDVFKCLLMGMTAKHIARFHNISPKTAEYHIANIKRKLQCNYKRDIIITAIQYGLATLDC